MSTKTFSIGECIKQAFNQVVQNWLLFLCVMATVLLSVSFTWIILMSISSAVAQAVPFLGWLLYILSNIAIALLQAFFFVGLMRIALDIYAGGKPVYKDLFRGTQYLKNYFLASIVFSLVVSLGYLLLIIPGFIWTIKYGLFGFVIVDQQASVKTSLQASAQLTSGVKWKLFALVLLIALINVIGGMLLYIGLFFSLPLSLLILTNVYHSLREQTIAPPNGA